MGWIGFTPTNAKPGSFARLGVFSARFAVENSIYEPACDTSKELESGLFVKYSFFLTL